VASFVAAEPSLRGVYYWDIGALPGCNSVVKPEKLVIAPHYLFIDLFTLSVAYMCISICATSTSR
jgi:hypothetical protein